MIPHFLFIHGWAMDRSLWTGLLARLGTHGGATGDLGCRVDGDDLPPAGVPVIAVCHSLGVMQTLDHPPPGLAGLIAINGFSRFSAAADHPSGVPARLLQRMRLGLERDPDAVVSDFRSRCGLDTTAPASWRLPALRQGLDLLCHGDKRQALRELRIPVLALAGRQDKIVPPALTIACFDDILWMEDAGHLLPATHPAFCADAIREFAGRIVG